MYATNHFETAFLNTMRGIDLVAPSSLYIALYISNPGDTGQGTEISYSGYVRRPVSFNVPALDAALNAIAIKNDSEITFATSPDDAGTITHIGIMDSLIGGNMWAYSEAREGMTADAGDAPVILQGELTYYSTGSLSDIYKTSLLNVLRGQGISGYIPHIALFNGNPQSGGGELSGDNYARVPLDMTAPANAASGQMESSNAAAVSFNRPTTNWGIWNYTALYTAASGGKPAWIDKKVSAKELKKDYMPRVAQGDLKVAIN